MFFFVRKKKRLSPNNQKALDLSKLPVAGGWGPLVTLLAVALVDAHVTVTGVDSRERGVAYETDEALRSATRRWGASGLPQHGFR